MIIFIIVPTLAAIVLAWLFIGERRRSLALRRNIVAELTAAAEPLEKVAYGLFDQTMKAPPAAVAPELATGMAAIRDGFGKLTAKPLKRLCFVGSDAWMEGSEAARVIGKRLSGHGRVAVLVTSRLDALIMSQRYRSFATTMAKEYTGVHLVEVFEARSDQERAAAWTKQNAEKLDAIYITGNSAAVGVSAGLRSLGQTKRPFVLCFDLDQTIATGIKDGIIGASLVCSTYAQGRDPLYHLYNHLTQGWKPLQERLLLTTHLVAADNLKQYWDDARAEPLKTSALNETGVKPTGSSTKTLRILIITEDWNNAFRQMNAAIEDATRILAPLNVEVVPFVLNQMKNPADKVVAAARERLEAERRRGLDGLSAFVGIPEIVPVLNSCAEAGIPVATFNSEPLGLRSMIHWLVGNIDILRRFSDEYRNGHGEITIAVKEVLNSLESMVANVARSAEVAREGTAAVAVLDKAIDETVEEGGRQTESVVGLTRIGEEIQSLADFFNNGIVGLQAMKERVENSSEKVMAVNDQSERIGAMIGTIGDIADRTALLAFNASIEASRAGSAGKGFKVIANEIRTLADKSAASAKDITARIDQIRKTVAESVQVNAQAQSMVVVQVNSVAEANTRLSAIVERLGANMAVARTAVERNAAALERMRRSAGGLGGVVSHSAGVSEENDRTIAALSGAFSEISAQFAEMDRQTTQLAELTQLLDSTVASFHVD